MMNYTPFLPAMLAALALLGGCITASDHHRKLGSTEERQMTLGTVQRELRKGMSQADVAIALGSPNIVTRDSQGRESWVYDRTATEASYSNGGHYLTLVLLGTGGSSGASSTTQRTLTVVIKFDDKNVVDSFAYHASRF